MARTDPGIIRHRGKTATINNAQRALELIDAEGSLVDWIRLWAIAEPSWGAARGRRADPRDHAAIHAAVSGAQAPPVAIRRPTTAYAFTQSEGLVNDHDQRCDAARPSEDARQV